MPATLAYVAGMTDPPVVQAFITAFIERADQVMAKRTILYAEVPSVVRTLQAAGVAQGIVSSKFRYRIEGILARERLAECFRVLVGAEDTPQHKPHPGGLLLAVSRRRCQPAEVVYVGDHPVDAEAAQQAGVSFVAVLTGLSGRGSFAERQVMAILDNLAGLPAVLGVLPA
jgi:phosphoglycolate phosphatase